MRSWSAPLFAALQVGLVCAACSAPARQRPGPDATQPLPSGDASVAAPGGHAAPPAPRDATTPAQRDAGQDGGSPTPAADAGGPLGEPDAGAAGTPSHGGTITFQDIGAPGFYPSRRDPASGECSAYQNGSCCMARHEIAGDALTPWDEELIMTLRGPIVAQQIAVYQPAGGSADWTRTADWDARAADAPRGLAFDGDATQGGSFAGTVGDLCLVDVMSDRVFPCGPRSTPYCPEPAAGQQRGYGFAGSKLVVLLLAMPHDGDGVIAPAQDCSADTTNNWHDAPWIGFSHGELVRAGKFGDCHCYAADPAAWWLADGCGQFNAFEVVNDNNEYRNLDLFSSNFFGYQGYVGEGPCGSQCDTSALPREVDLIDKGSSGEAAAGAIASPAGGPGAAFRRPTDPRYFVVLFDVETRTVQLAIIAPANVPAAAAPLLPELPERVARATIDALLDLRLPW